MVSKEIELNKKHLLKNEDVAKLNKPGTAHVGAISKAQKQEKEFKVSSILIYCTRMRKKFLKKS